MRKYVLNVILWVKNKQEDIYMTIKITNKEFDEIIANDNITLIDFYADWCGPCRALSPIIDEIAKEATNVTVGKVNVDTEKDLALKYKVRSIPTLVIFKGGNEISRMVGVLPKEEILAKIK